VIAVPATGLSPCSRDALSLLSDGKVEVDQERRPRRVVVILIDYKIVNQDVSIVMCNRPIGM
jgi:hypothetical protein